MAGDGGEGGGEAVSKIEDCARELVRLRGEVKDLRALCWTPCEEAFDDPPDHATGYGGDGYKGCRWNKDGSLKRDEPIDKSDWCAVCLANAGNYAAFKDAKRRLNNCMRRLECSVKRQDKQAADSAEKASGK